MPSRRTSKVREEAWQLAKFLSAPRQLLKDGLRSEAIETSSLSVLYGPQFDRHFRADRLSAVRQSRAVTLEERPFDTLGIEACVVVGDAVNAAVEKRAGVDDALKQIHAGLAALAPGIATGCNNGLRGSSPAKRGRGTAEGGGGGE